MKKIIIRAIFFLLVSYTYSQSDIVLSTGGAVGSANYGSATISGDGNVVFTYSGRSTTVNFGDENNLYFNFGTSAIKSTVYFCDSGYNKGTGAYRAAVYLYGKVTSPLSTQIYRVTIRIETGSVTFGSASTFKIGIYITTPKNSREEEDIKYHFTMGLPGGGSGRIADPIHYNNSFLAGTGVPLISSSTTRPLALILKAPAPVAPTSQDTFSYSSPVSATVVSSVSIENKFIAAGRNEGVTKLSSFIVGFASASSVQPIGLLLTNGELDYIHPDRVELYPKVLVGFASNQQHQKEGGASSSDVSDLKIHVKRTSAAAVVFGSGRGVSALPPLSVKFNILGGGNAVEKPTIPTSNTTSDVYYTRYASSLLIPVKKYTQTGSDVKVTPFSVFGNTVVNPDRKLSFSLSDGCNTSEVLGDIKYVDIDLGASTGWYTFTDDDRPNVEMKVVSTTGGALLDTSQEGGAKAKVEISIPNNTPTSGASYSIPIKISSSSTASASDYSISNLAAGAVVLDASNHYKVDLEITALADNFIEQDKELDLEFGTQPPYGVSFSGVENSARIMIKDSATPVALTLSGNFSISENVSDSSSKILLNSAEINKTGSDIIIPVVYTNSTANIGDFRSISREGVLETPIAFPASFVIGVDKNFGELEFKARDDSFFEKQEKLVINVPAVAEHTQNGIRVRATSGVTQDLVITDNDIPQVSLSWIPTPVTPPLLTVTKTEGGSNSTATLRVSIGTQNDTGHTITGEIGISGTATLGDDYSLTLNGTNLTNSSVFTVEIPDGEDHADVTLTATDDVILESLEESVIFRIRNFSDNVSISQTESEATFNILDNEKPRITISKVSDGIEPDGSTAGTDIRFNITSDLPVNNTGVPLTFNVAYSGTATLGDDFSGPTTVSIAPGQRTTSLNLEVLDDDFLENQETVTATLSSTQVLSPNSVLISPEATIKNTDLFDVFISSTAGKEGGADLVYNLSINKVNETGHPIVLPLSFTGTATQADFGTTFPTTASIPNGASSSSISLAVQDDNFTEGLEKLKLEVLHKDGNNIDIPFMDLTGDYSNEGNVQDNDSYSLVVNKISDGSETGEIPIKFKFELSQINNTGQDIIIFVSFVNVTTEISDFKNLPNSVIIKDGQREGILSLGVADDNLFERDREEVQVNINGTSYPNITFATGSISGFIVDNDTAVLSVTSLGDVTEGSGRDLVFRISLDKVNHTGSSILLTNSFNSNNTSSVPRNGWADAADFTSSTALATGNIVIPNGSKEEVVSMGIRDDILLENKEKVGLEVSIPAPAANLPNFYSRLTGDTGSRVASAEANIIDNEGLRLDVTSSASTIDEGGSATITFKLNFQNNTGSDLVFTPSYSGSLSSEDFGSTALPLPRTIDFPDGTDEVTYDLVTKLDHRLEPDEDFIISFLPANNPKLLGPSQVSIQVRENDDAHLTITGTDGQEGVTPVIFTVSLGAGNTINATGGDIQLFYRLNSGTGNGNADTVDFTDIPVSAVIPAGESSATISLEGLDDNLLENTEDVSILVSRSSNRNINATLTNINLPGADASLTENNVGVINVESRDEVDGGSTLVLKYVLLGNKINELGGPIVITPKFSGTASQGDFLTPFPATVSIPEGSSYAEVRLDVKEYDTPVPEKTMTAGIQEIEVGGTTSSISKGVDKPVLIKGFTGVLPEVNVDLKRDSDGSETPSKDISFTVSLADNELAPISSPVVVNLLYSGEATADDFVDALPSQVEIPAGEHSVRVNIKVKEDFIYEQDKEDLIVKIGSVQTTGFSFDLANSEIELFVKDSKRVRAFEVFNDGLSPNGDGINDVFKIKHIEDMLFNELFIVNREGATVYHERNYNNTWGGVDYRGNKLPMGNYYYIFLYKLKYTVQGRAIYIKEKAKGSLFIK